SADLKSLAMNEQAPENARVQALWTGRLMSKRWSRTRLPDYLTHMNLEWQLDRVFQDPSPAMRRTLMRILDEDHAGFSNPDGFGPRVLTCLNDSNPRVRLQAFVTLSSLTIDARTAAAL